MIQSKMRNSANEQAKELIMTFYPGSDVKANREFSSQYFKDESYTNEMEDWRWDEGVTLSIKCCDKIIEALRIQPIIFTGSIEYWMDVKQILESKK